MVYEFSAIHFTMKRRNKNQSNKINIILLIFHQKYRLFSLCVYILSKKSVNNVYSIVLGCLYKQLRSSPRQNSCRWTKLFQCTWSVCLQMVFLGACSKVEGNPVLLCPKFLAFASEIQWDLDLKPTCITGDAMKSHAGMNLWLCTCVPYCVLCAQAPL